MLLLKQSLTFLNRQEWQVPLKKRQPIIQDDMDLIRLAQGRRKL